MWHLKPHFQWLALSPSFHALVVLDISTGVAHRVHLRVQASHVQLPKRADTSSFPEPGYLPPRFQGSAYSAIVPVSGQLPQNFRALAVRPSLKGTLSPGSSHHNSTHWVASPLRPSGAALFSGDSMKDLLRVLRIIRLKRRFRELQKHGFYRDHWKGRGGVRKKWPPSLLKVYEKLEEEK